MKILVKIGYRLKIDEGFLRYGVEKNKRWKVEEIKREWLNLVWYKNRQFNNRKYIILILIKRLFSGY